MVRVGLCCAGRHTTAQPLPWPVERYGAIRNMEPIALVSPVATMEWACLPGYASPSVFASLLDPVRRGCASLGTTDPILRAA